MEGIELASRFSSAPNLLGLCGPKGFDSADRKRLASQLKKFRAPYAYYSLIASANRRKPFDYDVVEAFWLGNKLLESVKREDVAEMIKAKFTGKGRLTRARADELAACLPQKAYLHHSFHVFYIGSISGVLEGKKKELDLCRVSWGRIARMGKNKLSVCSKPVQFTGKSASFGHRKNTSWHLPAYPTSFRIGDKACSHWGVAIMKISPRQEKNLQKYTELNMGLYATRPPRQ